MRRRLENLPPLGDLVATEVAKCGFTVENFCAVAHIGKTTYYKLLFGKTLWRAYTSDSCAVWGSITQRRSLSSSSSAISMRCFYKLRVQSEKSYIDTNVLLQENDARKSLFSSFFSNFVNRLLSCATVISNIATRFISCLISSFWHIMFFSLHILPQSWALGEYSDFVVMGGYFIITFFPSLT